jgi:ketosteroid isomerase-like protein
MCTVAQEPVLRAVHRTVKEADVSQTDFDGAVEGYRQALGAFMTGDPIPVTEFFSRRDDVTLANPLGPPQLGPTAVDQAIAAGAANLRDGSTRGFEEVSRYSTPDLGYVVQIERAEARLPGSDDMSPLALRVTMIFRREGDTWKVAHRHADPITTARPITTVIET